MATCQVMVPKCEGFCIYGFATFNLTRQIGQTGLMGEAYGHIGATCTRCCPEPAPSVEQRALCRPRALAPRLMADGFDTMLSYHPALDVSIAIGTNMEVRREAGTAGYGGGDLPPYSLHHDRATSHDHDADGS